MITGKTKVVTKMSKEVWRDVVGYEGFYQVSDLGRVRSVDRIIVEKATGIKRKLKGRLLTPAIRSNGYAVVNLGRNNHRRVHHIVMDAFVGTRKEGFEVDHINRNRADNRLENLRYITVSENHAQGNESKRKPVCQIRNGKTIRMFESASEAARNMNCSPNVIQTAARGAGKTACGYEWRYV